MKDIDNAFSELLPSGFKRRLYGCCAKAQVAELVDAQVSGTCGRKVVEVRVFSWAPILISP